MPKSVLLDSKACLADSNIIKYVGLLNISECNLMRIKKLFCLRMVSHLPMPNKARCFMAKLGGVRIDDWKHVFIGEGVIFDSIFSENISIGVHTHVTMRCIILTHSLDTTSKGVQWKSHYVKIGDNCFIGANTVIVSNVVIGDNSIVGAGSVVTKDIPPNEIWAGNPARFIKKRTP